MSNTKPLSGPVSPQERILSLDVLRGFAILGILVMNIQSYAMIQAAYLNPTAFGDLSGFNKWAWIFSHILADQKFMTIFSILFGAGIVLMTRRAEAKKRSAAKWHYRRTFWLLIIGLFHAYILWCGDILVPYAFCSILAFVFRKFKARNLLIIGLILILVSSLLYLFMGLTMPHWPPEVKESNMQFWNPSPEDVQHEVEAYRGGWLDQMTHRVPSSLVFETLIFFIWTGWRAGGLMLLGMALFKWSVLTAERSKSFYIRMLSVSLPLGWIVVILGIVQNFAHNWSHEYSMFLGWQFNYWGSILVSLGYIALIMLISINFRTKRMVHSLAAVGRMALSNYLFQTVICTFLFYGHGLGFFGRVERRFQILIVVSVWAIQLMISPIWLRHFRFGPVEWMWRSLIYLKLQPFRMNPEEEIS